LDQVKRLEGDTEMLALQTIPATDLVARPTATVTAPAETNIIAALFEALTSPDRFHIVERNGELVIEVKH
jgi:hypothetical protein